MTNYKVRKATEADVRRYWEINNSPEVRAVSIQPRDIPWEDHLGWYSSSLDRADRSLWVIESDGKVVGTLRFDLDEGETWTVSIALDSSVRGQGIGSAVLEESPEHATMAGEIVALIRPDNVASIRAFERAGYVRVGRWEVEGVDLVRYAIRPGKGV